MVQLRHGDRGALGWLNKILAVFADEDETFADALDSSVASSAADPSKALGAHLSATYVSAAEVRSIVVLTQAEYDALTPDAATLYMVVG